ncbi:hypothetical protein FNV43_RR26588 [Rhamnella rubrinervis]|uniref:Uncharacterized protein n=1 Tax=Rhamnella rubrinervis TaxID=2594499 RepID=A0A8K0DIU5_9ROSA|nr:hypothetical protein FNV43_RR26588 [Rhamnella rubrinervis]
MILIRKVGANSSAIIVADLLDSDTGWWKENLVRDTLEENSAEEVLKLKVSTFADKGFNNSEDCNGLWKDLWKLMIYDKLGIFTWRVVEEFSLADEDSSYLPSFKKEESIPVILRGSFSVNTEIAMCNRCSILAMTIKDDEGKLIFLASEKVQK